MPKELVELKLGIVTTRELAQWFGISYDSFRAVSKRKYEELKEYCEYEKLYGKIRVTKIYETPCYYYGKMTEQDKIFNKLVKEEWPREYPETCVHFVESILDREEIQKLDLKYESVVYRIRKAKNRQFGKIKRGKSQGYGVTGKSSYIMAKKSFDDNGRSSLAPIEDEKELKLWNEIRHKYYGNIKQRVDIATASYYGGQINEDAFVLLVTDTTDKESGTQKYLTYKTELAAALHCNDIVKATWVTDYIGDEIKKYLVEIE